jgi:hypothetical protein
MAGVPPPAARRGRGRCTRPGWLHTPTQCGEWSAGSWTRCSWRDPFRPAALTKAMVASPNGAHRARCRRLRPALVVGPRCASCQTLASACRRSLDPEIGSAPRSCRLIVGRLAIAPASGVLLVWGHVLKTCVAVDCPAASRPCRLRSTSTHARAGSGTNMGSGLMNGVRSPYARGRRSRPRRTAEDERLERHVSSYTSGHVHLNTDISGRHSLAAQHRAPLKLSYEERHVPTAQACGQSGCAVIS